MTTTGLCPTGPSSCWLLLRKEQRSTIPAVTSRSQRVSMSSWALRAVQEIQAAVQEQGWGQVPLWHGSEQVCMLSCWQQGSVEAI